jgi:ABC-type transport system involved in cytochrome c biogenesis permease subunit
MIALLALVVTAVLAKIALTDQPWPDSRALVRGIFIVAVFGAVPLVARWLRRRR